MIIRCDTCQTEFSLDDAQIDAEGASVRCSVCASVFKVVAPDPRDSGTRSWQVRTRDSLLFSARTLGVLRRWIVEGRLHPDDEVSRTGRRWLRLGAIPEFSSAFGNLEGLPVVLELMERRASIYQMPPRRMAGTDSAFNAPQSTNRSSGGATPAFSESSSPAPLLSAKRTQSDLIAYDEGDAVSDSSGPEGKALAALEASARSSAALSQLPSPDTLEDESEERPAQADDDAPRAVRRPNRITSDLSIPMTPDAVPSVSSPIANRAMGGGKRTVMWALGALASGALLVAGLRWIAPKAENTAQDEARKAALVKPPTVDERPPELERAQLAVASLITSETSRAEAELQRLIGRSDLSDAVREQAKFLLAELLIRRSLQLSLAATIAGDKADDIATAARSDLDRALRFMDAGAFVGIEEEKLAALRVRLRFAEGRPLREISTMLPSSGARDLRLLVLAAPVWRDIEQALDEDMVAELGRGVKELGSETPVLLGSALAVAKLRSGDSIAAAQWAHERIAVANEDPVATRIIAHVAAASESKSEGSSVATAGESSKKTEEEAAPASLEDLLDRGCSLVERGAASSGVTTLLKAFDRDPENLDVMVCLAQGYSRTGRNIRALTFFERVLARSPEHRTALYGAATAAAAQGDHRRASQYYERLLRVVPDHGPAAAYLELHGD